MGLRVWLVVCVGQKGQVCPENTAVSWVCLSPKPGWSISDTDESGLSHKGCSGPGQTPLPILPARLFSQERI